MAARKTAATRADPEAKRTDLIDLHVAYKQVFTTPEGQVVIQDLLRRFGHNRNPMFVPDEPGRQASRTEDLIFKEGQRSVLMHVGNMVDAIPARIESQGKTEHG